MHVWQERGDVCSFHAVNRLDRGTSGLMAAAKNGYCHSILSSYLHTDKFCRTYLAVVYGKFEQSRGEINAPIGRDLPSIVKRCVCEDGADALTYYEVIDSIGEYSLVRLTPMTGRTHQLRVHMAYIGHPLVGDFLYGKEEEFINRPALHSSKCVFYHPTRRILMEFSAPLPDDMRKIMYLDK